MTAKLILASASPRRKDLLEETGVAFEVIPSRIVENFPAGQTAQVSVKRLAEEKAVDVAKGHPDRWTLGADTIVVLPGRGKNGNIMGKPRNAEEARGMLLRLSAKHHWVMTGVAFARLNEATGSMETDAFVVTSMVRFRMLSHDEIGEYVSSGEPLDKAGAYAIQGGARKFVERYEGSFSNIVGLPVEEVLEWIKNAGIMP